MATACIGIGSNLGDRQAYCMDAIERLRAAGCVILRISSFIETEPWGLTDQPPFLNGAVLVETVLPPHDLLKLLLSVESSLGRIRTKPWGPRCIDLDILLYDSTVVESSELTIPHPLLHTRAFALEPLAEIVPDAVHPLLNKTIRELFREVHQ
jgi:2-amino-4-hydroxy-6-hydroxymethyldihydropteridine diphosphokinase